MLTLHLSESMSCSPTFLPVIRAEGDERQSRRVEDRRFGAVLVGVTHRYRLGHLWCMDLNLIGVIPLDNRFGRIEFLVGSSYFESFELHPHGAET